MKSPAPIISKDLVNELKSLAVQAVSDDASFEAAHEKFVVAGTRLSSSAASFAAALYDFALRYAGQPALVNDKLRDLGITFKSPSVCQCISRLAFDDVPGKDTDAIRQKTWRYGRLIELAYEQGKSADDFKKLVNKSIASAMQKLGAAPKDTSTAIDLGRQHASKLFANQSVPLATFALPSSIELKDGDDIELLAKFEGGQLVVYGLVPPSMGNPAAVLSKIGAPLLPKKKAPLALLPDLQRALKLATSDKDEKSLATYDVREERLHFTIATGAATVVLSASSDFDFLSGNTLTLTVADWGRVFASLTPLAKIISNVSFDGKTLVATAKDDATTNLGRWYEDNGKVITIGKAIDTALHIPLKGEPAGTHVVESSAWQHATTLNKEGLKSLLTFKPTEAVATFKLGTKTLAVKSSPKLGAGQVNLKRKQLSLLKKASAKLLRLSPEVTLDSVDTQLRISALAANGILYMLMIETA